MSSTSDIGSVFFLWWFLHYETLYLPELCSVNPFLLQLKVVRHEFPWVCLLFFCNSTSTPTQNTHTAVSVSRCGLLWLPWRRRWRACPTGAGRREKRFEGDCWREEAGRVVLACAACMMALQTWWLSSSILRFCLLARVETPTHHRRICAEGSLCCWSMLQQCAHICFEYYFFLDGKMVDRLCFLWKDLPGSFWFVVKIGCCLNWDCFVCLFICFLSNRTGGKGAPLGKFRKQCRGRRGYLCCHRG